MQEITQERLQKNLNFLNEVYEITKDNFVSLNQDKLIKKHELSKGCFITSAKMGWIIQKGKHRNTTYKWRVRKPDLKMARIFILESSDDIKKYRERRIDKRLNNTKGIVGMVTTQKLPIINNTIQKRLKYNNLKSKENNNIEKQKEVKNKEFSLMWGLIKIKY